jgi:hypothetical protein
MNTLIRLVFSSDVTGTLDASTLQQIAAASERNNWRDGITGVLLIGPRRFVQVLEGERADVSACFARIASDARNSRLSAAQPHLPRAPPVRALDHAHDRRDPRDRAGHGSAAR